MQSIDALLKAHCSPLEYIEFTKQWPDKYMAILATAEPESEPFDHLYRRYMESCISKKQQLLSLRCYCSSSYAGMVRLLNNELASVQRQMDWTGFRTQPASRKLKKNNHALNLRLVL